MIYFFNGKIKIFIVKNTIVRDFFKHIFENYHKKHHDSIAIWELFFEITSFSNYDRMIGFILCVNQQIFDQKYTSYMILFRFLLMMT